MIKFISAVALLSAASLAYANNTNQNIQLKNDQQTLEFSLPANATTGYQWYVQSYDHSLLSLQDYEYATNANSKGMTGVGGTANFIFNIDPSFYNAPQATTIILVYKQAWNPDQDASTATINVSATESNNDSMDWQKYPISPDKIPSPDPSTDSTRASNWISLPNNS